MPNITYSWNPFQTIVDNRIVGEVLKPASTNNRREFLVRRGPFFSRNFKLSLRGSSTPLDLGVDYVFAHNFDRFINDYSRNVFGSVILTRDFTHDELVCDYDTIGGPFVLDEAEFIALAANIINRPREANWEDLVGVPETWPSDPHKHPITQTYDYEEMMVALRSLIIAVKNNNANGDRNPTSLLNDHLGEMLTKSHKASKKDLGLTHATNMCAAKNSDLDGNSGNRVITVATLKEALRRYSTGDLNID